MFVDPDEPEEESNLTAKSLISSIYAFTDLHMRWFALTIVAVVVVDILFLRYAYISFFCLLAGLGTLHLIYIIARNKCARECPVLFA